MFRPIIVTMLMTSLLSGCLPALFGTAASSSLDFAKDRSARETVQDYKISIAMKKRFMIKGFSDLYSRITVEVIEGRVMLLGEVKEEEDINRAIEIAWSVRGVTEVINELKISENSARFDAVDYTNDSWITTQIKTSLFFHRGVKFSNYTVVTQRAVVYLFGIARSQDELANVAHVAASTKGVSKVESYVRVKDVVNDDELIDDIDSIPEDDQF